MAVDAITDAAHPASEGRHSREAVYAALYDLAQEHASAADMQIAIPREAFVINAMQHPNCIDASLFDGLDSHTYITALFWSVLNRVPDPSEMTAYEKNASRESDKRFRKNFRNSLALSLEARIKRVRCVPHSFEGLDRVECFRGNRVHSFSPDNIKYWFDIHILEPLLGFMYRVYCHTLRPIRIKYREARKPVDSGTSSTDGRK